MLATTAVGEVEDDGLQRAELRAAVAPQLGSLRLAVAGPEHRHGHLVRCVDSILVAGDCRLKMTLPDAYRPAAGKLD